jgi:hypothetical protein
VEKIIVLFSSSDPEYIHYIKAARNIDERKRPPEESDIAVDISVLAGGIDKFDSLCIDKCIKVAENT